MMNDNQIKEALKYLKDHDDRTLEDQVNLCAIGAPSFEEAARGEKVKALFEEIGLADISRDQVGNVIGYIYGQKKRPLLLLSAHMDTVFPIETDTKVKVKDGLFYAPGIGDNTRGLAEIIATARAIKAMSLDFEGSLMVCGNVCEEGQGDLKGVKYLFENHTIDGFVTPDVGQIGHIKFKATGSKRYQVTYKGTGGHSFGDFGLPNPIHAVGRAIAKISNIRVPKIPKTTFSVGLIQGGTSINTIASEASFSVDLRSNEQDSLNRLENTVLKLILDARDEENTKWHSEDLQVEMKVIGERPSGQLKPDNVIVMAAVKATEAIGVEPIFTSAGSTDANIPISLGIPAVQVGFGGLSGGTHTLKEWYNPEGSYQGPQRQLLIITELLGYKREALLPIR